MLAQDVLNVVGDAGDRERLTRTEPLRLPRPQAGRSDPALSPARGSRRADRGEPVLPGYDAPPAGDAMAKAMSFHLGAEGAASAVGRIDAGTAEAFRRISGRRRHGRSPPCLHSPGGSVRDAIEMATLIRERKLETEVPAGWLLRVGVSARPRRRRCAAGGESAWVGVHQVYAVPGGDRGQVRDLDRSVAQIQATIAECQSLLVAMDVDRGSGSTPCRPRPTNSTF